ALARGGADLIKDDELLGNQAWCPLEERVRAVVAAIPERVRYAANVTGPVDGLLRRSERAVELGASALMVNAFAQGVDALRALRAARAVLGGGVGPENAAEHVRRAGAGSRLLVLLGSRAYAHPGGVEEGVRAAVEAVKA